MTQLQRAHFQKLKPDTETTVGEAFPVMFNPGELTVNKGVQLAEVPIPGLDSPLLQFVRGQAETLSLDLFFDTTDEGTAVTAETDKFYELIKIHDETHAPAILRFTWGPAGAFPGANLSSFYARQKRENGFTCVVDSVRQRFTLWNAAGVPLRATLTVSLREFKTLDGQIEELNLKSADHTHSHVVQQGETLTRIAAAVYEDAREWRRIAERNAIVDPLSLQPGTMLLVPPLT